MEYEFGWVSVKYLKFLVDKGVYPCKSPRLGEDSRYFLLAYFGFPPATIDEVPE